MADFTDTLTDRHIAFIEAQPLFFTATAAAEGRINLSPKGSADSFRIISPRRVVWLALGGSGNEPTAPLAADGRFTLMFCPFHPHALLLPLHCHGPPGLPPDPGWD